MFFDSCHGLYDVDNYVTPLVYDEAVSYEQQLASLMKDIKELAHDQTNYLLLSKFYEFLKNLEKDEEEQSKQLKNYADTQVKRAKKELEQEEKQKSHGYKIYNTQHGDYEQNKETMRELFNDVTIHSLTVEELANSDKTVEDVAESGLNVQGLACMSAYLVNPYCCITNTVFYKEPTQPRRVTAQILANALINEYGQFVEAKRAPENEHVCACELKHAVVDDEGVITRDVHR